MRTTKGRMGKRNLAKSRVERTDGRKAVYVTHRSKKGRFTNRGYFDYEMNKTACCEWEYRFVGSRLFWLMGICIVVLVILEVL